MSDSDDFGEEHDELSYLPLVKIDFSVIASRMKWLPLFDDDLF